jgi:CheY-specific phosphatase CheX
MSHHGLQMGPAIEDAVNTVLETMFFESAETAPANDLESLIWFAVGYSGVAAGTAYLGVRPQAARELSAAFSGEDPAAWDGDPAAAMMEMANMICGGVLSRIEPDGYFDLDSPRRCGPPPPGMECRGFQTTAGRVVVGLLSTGE